MTFGSSSMNASKAPPTLHRRVKSCALNPFEDPALFGDMVPEKKSHSRHTSDTSSVLSAFDPYSAHNSPKQKQKHTFELPQHTIDPEQLASIAAELSELKPQLQSQQSLARPTLHQRKSSRNLSDSVSLSNLMNRVFSSNSPSRKSVTTKKKDSSSARSSIVSSSARSSARSSIVSQSALYTSELEPAPHQVSMPSHNACLTAARLTQWAHHVQNVLGGEGLESLKKLSPLALQRQEGPAATTLKECGIDDIMLLHSSIDACILSSDCKRLIWVVCNQHEFSFSKFNSILDNHVFYDVCFTGFRTVQPTLASVEIAQARPDVLVSCLTIAMPKLHDALPVKHLAHSLPNYQMIRLEHASDVPSTSSSLIGHLIMLGGSTTRAYLFDKHKSNKVVLSIFKTESSLETFVSSLERIAHLGLPWPHELEGTKQQGKNQVV
eukprot:CAMPEP_0197826002 /NCGR_PEP_ID=MMETSP1437-20131217/3019_1 /TAXON_ID=49252 ORGANISM="Eucampia antarctica, Strain CCMP1452" /NCGR_SAMPLE_ID=MMETSP1437 /ASSEMBLY_ACC=CAM_ASM_001096 /LENGTH=436 /DNA_ID=CAMNT_0043426243 /DNA_START=284 /DNA_END=1594 /DNA_ORIENTATION=-